MAYAELIQLKSQYETYQKAVAATKKLLGCERIIRSRILPLPDFPKLSEHFERQYQEMIDQENECLICFNHLDKQDLENIFTCSVCKSSTHLKCVEEWFQTSRTCPHCRDKWNWERTILNLFCCRYERDYLIISVVNNDYFPMKILVILRNMWNKIKQSWVLVPTRFLFLFHGKSTEHQTVG